MRFNLIRISHSNQVYLNKPLTEQRARSIQLKAANKVIRIGKLHYLGVFYRTKRTVWKLESLAQWFMIVQSQELAVTRAQASHVIDAHLQPM